jgi:phage tail-like protein
MSPAVSQCLGACPEELYLYPATIYCLRPQLKIMAIYRDTPYGNAQFLVEIDNINKPGFLVAQLPDLILDQTEYREGGDALLQSTPVAKRPHFGTLVLKRGFHGGLDLYNWWKDAATGQPNAKRNGTITLQTEDRTANVAAWHITGALPVRYGFSPLDGQDGGTLIEMIEIACQNVAME